MTEHKEKIPSRKRPAGGRKNERSWDVLNIIRGSILLILLIYIGILLALKGGSNASFESVSKAVLKVADVKEMTKGTERDLKRYYGLNIREFDDVMFYYTNETMGVEELLVIKLSSEQDAQATEEAIQKRLDTQIDNFEGYGAEQVKLLKESLQKTKGNYVFFAVSPNAEKLEKAFLKSL